MTRKKNAKPELPVDPLAAVGPLMAWWFQTVELIDRIAAECCRIDGQLMRPNSPWHQFVDAGKFREVAMAIHELSDNLPSPFKAGVATVDPFIGIYQPDGERKGRASA